MKVLLVIDGSPYPQMTISMMKALKLPHKTQGIAENCASATKPIETEPNFIGFITEIHPNQEGGISVQLYG